MNRQTLTDTFNDWKLLFGALGLAAAAGVAYAAMPTRAEVTADAKEHDTSIVSHSVQFKAVETLAASAKVSADAARGAAERAEKSITGIGIKIDFLIQNELQQAQRTSSGRIRVREAARRARPKTIRRGDRDDPLAALDGL